MNSSVRVANLPTDYEYIIPGAILMDGLLHSFCFGFVLALAQKYWEDYGDDSVRKRAFVAAVVLLSTLQTVLQDYKLWVVTIFRRPWSSSPLLPADVFISGLVCSLCEAFYIRRCWKMTGKRPWVLYPMIFLWLSIVAANFFIAITLHLEFGSAGQTLEMDAARSLHQTLVVFSYWVSGSTVLDTAVAAILIFCLVKAKTGFEASNSVLYRIILLTLETALLPSISMIISVLILNVAPNPGTHDDLVLFFVLITAKLYTIGVLRTLNARAKLRERIHSQDVGRTSLKTWTWDQQTNQDLEEPERSSSPCQALTASAMLRASVVSSAPTFISRARYEGVATQEKIESPGTRPQADDNSHIHFGSPLLDQYERGSFARHRVSSIYRANPPQRSDAE